MNSAWHIKHIKDIITSSLLNDDNVVHTLDEGCTDPNELVYSHIYPTMRVPDTETEQNTIICMAVDVHSPASLKNNLSKQATIYVRMHTHQDQQRVSSGPARGYVRLDYLSSLVENIICSPENALSLVDTRFVYNREGQLDTKHPCREMKFTAYVTDFKCDE